MKHNILIGAALVTAGILGTAPAAQSDDQACIYAYNARQYFGVFERGMYSMDIDGSNITQLWKDSFSYNPDGATVSPYSMSSGWIRNNRLCGIYSVWPNDVPQTIRYLERDIKTGEVLKDEVVSISTGDFVYIYVAATYCPVNDCVYGLGVNSQGIVLTKAPADKLDQAVSVGPVGTLLYSMTYNEELGMLVAVAGNSSEGCNRLVKIDPATGAISKIMDLHPEATTCTLQGLTWVPSLQRYLYDQITYETQADGSELLMLNPENNTHSVLVNFAEPYDFRFMMTVGDKNESPARSPKEVTDLKANFAKLSGNFSFTLPTELVNGDAISGDISYNVYIDGESKLTGSGAAGSQVTTNNVTMSSGYHLYRVVLTCNNSTNVPQVFGFTAGTEQPLAPTNVTLTASTLSWDAVTNGINGGALSDVTYTAKVNGMTVANNITATTVDVSSYINTTGRLTAYTATVTATSNGSESRAAVSNKLVEGAPLSVPFTLAPTEAEVDICTTADVDGNGISWSYEPANDEGRKPGFLSGYDMRGACDDWLFTPNFMVSDKAVYTASIDAVLADQNLKGGTLAMYVGKEPNIESMKVCLVPALTMTSNDEYRYTGQFTVDGELAGADRLYIALQSTSAAGKRCPIFVRNLSVTKTDGIDVPTAVTDLKAARSEKGGMSLDITFKLPVKNADGTAISAQTVDATVSLAQNLSTTIKPASVKISGAPGAEVTATIQGDACGNLITVTPSVNGKNGVAANTTFDLSAPIPGLVENLTASYSEDNCTIYFNWEAPTTDANGNPVEPGQRYTYNIYQLNNDNQYELQLEGLTTNFADVNMSGTDVLFGMEIAVAAVNASGVSPRLQKIYCQVGTPYDLPMADDLDGATFRYEPVDPLNISETLINTVWGAPDKLGLGSEFNDASVGDVIAAIPTGDNANLRLSFPKFSSLGKNATTLTFDMWTGAKAAASSVWCQAYDMAAPELVGNVDNSKDGYNKVTFTLPEKYLNQPWVWIFLDSSFATADQRMVLASYSFTAENSGVSEIAGNAAGQVSAVRNTIVITGFTGETAEIYTLDGAKKATVTANGNTSVAVGQGVYIVRIAGRSYKVIAK